MLTALLLGTGKSTPLVLWAVWLYTGHALAIAALLWRWVDLPKGFGWTVQIADIFWPCLLSLLTNQFGAPPLIFFFFGLVAAAFRWGVRETVLVLLVSVTAMGCVVIGAMRGWLAQLNGLSLDVNLVLRIGSLATIGVLIGYLVEREKTRRSEIKGIFHVASQASIDSGLNASLDAILREVLTLFRARQVILLARVAGEKRFTRWQARLGDDGNPVSETGPIDENGAGRYLFELPPHSSAVAWVRSNPKKAIAIHRENNSLTRSDYPLPQDFQAEHPLNWVLAGGIPFASDVSCRVFIVDPRCGGGAKSQLVFLRDLINKSVPAIYNVYRLHRLQSRVTMAERSRIARELHDGVVQALHAIAFRLYALRTGTQLSDREHTAELLELQELVQKEASQLRHMMQHLQGIELRPAQLIEFLTAMIERYRYDTGINAKLACPAQDLNVPAATCREIAGIVQEALANVYRHSGAENVTVSLATLGDACVLTVEDDGRGFEFSGRRSLAELEGIRRGPLIIKQRARAIGADLIVDSRPGQGARLEMRFPVQSPISYNNDVPNSHSYRR
jgi:signal transduction histidine kinase